jgi:hypothetical protein
LSSGPTKLVPGLSQHGSSENLGFAYYYLVVKKSTFKTINTVLTSFHGESDLYIELNDITYNKNSNEWKKPSLNDYKFKSNDMGKGQDILRLT